MEEIEVKFLEIDVKEIERRLIEIGAKKVFEGELNSIYFDFVDRLLEKEGKILRLRKKGEKTYLTYKKVIDTKKAKVMEEFELEVSDFILISKIFEGIGLVPLYEFRSYRTSYQLNEIKFEIDQYHEIPPFLEVEVPDLRELNKVVLKLGLSHKEPKPFSIKEVLKHYRKI
ncbi:MAG: class IV adenylate cyclase [candidate division WOR-3 bacterium]